MTSNDRCRRAYYAFILALPIATFIGLFVTGRWQAFWHAFRGAAQGSAADFDSAFATALIWSLSTLPLTLTAWNLGRRHTAARRLNYELLIGLREVWRLAIGYEQSLDQAAAFQRAPGDRVWIAALLGIGIAVLVPLFFMSFAPDLRTRAGAIWLGGAGILMGTMAYCHRRASAYLVEEPKYLDLFRQFRLLNPNRYSAPGRPFVRAQIVCTVLLPIWWLGGGSIAFVS